MYKLLVTTFLMLTTVIADLSYYEILEVSKTASIQEIKQSYKKMAVQYHPDKNPDGKHQEEFLKITEAYETLKDPEKRSAYDNRGSCPFQKKEDLDRMFHYGLYHDDPNVDSLSPEDFYKYFEPNKFHFINFYSPFCPPCQRVTLHWKSVAMMYKGIVKIASVNCKKYGEFCFRAMNIDGYPTLLFYPNGKHDEYQEFTGERSTEALDDFLSTFLRAHVPLPVVTQIQDIDEPTAYVLGVNRMEINGLTRIGYQLKGLVTFNLVEDDVLRLELTKDESVTIIFKYKDSTKEYHSTDENEILEVLSKAFNKIDLIDPETYKNIRDELCNGSNTPWLLYFSLTTKDNDTHRLRLNQMTVAHRNLRFGEIDCDTWNDFCGSFEIDEPPAWAILKQGGSLLRIPRLSDVASATEASLQSVSAPELQAIREGDMSHITWVFVVAPVGHEWSHFFQPFAKASLLFKDEDVSLRLCICTLAVNEFCRDVHQHWAVVLVVFRAKGYYYHSEKITEDELVDFVKLIQESPDMEISVNQVLEIQDLDNRNSNWLVAFFPAECGRNCDAFRHEWRIVSRHLRPLEDIKVRALECDSIEDFCLNVREPVARLYSVASRSHNTITLREVGVAPFMLEWALKNYDESISELKWHTFHDHVLSSEPDPSSSGNGSLPWLVYFHSPRCYHCHERYSYFGVAGLRLNKTVQRGRVNCFEEDRLCNNEEINKYPTLRLYFGKEFVTVELGDYDSILNDIKPHILKHDPKLLDNLEKSHVHDEF